MQLENYSSTWESFCTLINASPMNFLAVNDSTSAALPAGGERCFENVFALHCGLQ